MTHTFPRSTLTVAAALLLTGCAVGPDYTRPDAPVPAQYKQAPAAPVDAYGARWQSAQPADEAPTGAWWRVFQNLAVASLKFPRESTYTGSTFSLQPESARMAVAMSNRTFFISCTFIG
ncbi:MAG: hypothetical protein IIT59_03770 [Rhodocyclaceae bacterium]|nr:hypothetical protein [Rhodocyclaceae bacterium]